jgi:hypothetical protein
MITGEKAASLESLQAEMLELKRSVEKSLEQLQTLIATRNQDSSVDSEKTDATYISFEDASKHVRANYSRLLHKLSQ